MLMRTERLTIRAWREDEAERLLDILRREEIVRWLGHPRTLETVEEAREKIGAMALEPPLSEWAYAVSATDEVAGSIMLVPIPKSDGLVQVGWYAHPDSLGRGYTTEAARALLVHGFAHGLEEIHALTHTDNHPSQAVARRLGMTYLGVTEEWYDEPSSHYVITAADLQANSD